MARVTVEDCIDKVPNRFELVLLSSHRSRQISAGSAISIDRDNDKNPVVALREIADEQLSPGDLKEDPIHSLQKHVEVDEPEDEMEGAEAETIVAGDVRGSLGKCKRSSSFQRSVGMLQSNSVCSSVGSFPLVVI